MALFAFLEDDFPPYDEASVATWFQPGRVVFVEALVERGVTLGRLYQLPFHHVIMSVRDATLQMFSVDMLKLFDDAFSSVELLFSPWASQLDARSCHAIGLTIERLRADGLGKHHVQALFWPMGAWEDLFGMTPEDVAALGIRLGHRFFACDAQGTPAVTAISL